MKTLHIHNSLYLLLFIWLFIGSCTQNSKGVHTLRQAQNIIDTQPEQAYQLLRNIIEPESMSRDNYMQYIVAYTQAKFESGRNISRDTAIYEAQRYFETHNNPTLRSQSNFYKAFVFFQNEVMDQAMKYFLKAGKYAEGNNDYLLAGRSYNNVGYIFIEQEMDDSTLVYYKKALDLYKNIETAPQYLVTTIMGYGTVNSYIDNFDTAQEYYAEALRISSETGYDKWIPSLYNNIGVAYLYQKDYDQSFKSLYKGLSSKPSTSISILLYLNLSHAYNIISKTDSSQHYFNLMAQNIKNAESLNILFETYQCMSHYYQLIGNKEKFLHYHQLKIQTKEKIIKQNQTDKLIQARMEYSTEQQSEDFQRANRNTLLACIALFIISIATIIIIYIRSELKRETDEKVRTYLITVDRNIRNKSQGQYSKFSINFLLAKREIAQLNKQSNQHAKQKWTDPNYYLNHLEARLKKYNFKSYNELIQWAKNYFDTLIIGSELTQNLSDNLIILLALRCHNLSDEEIAIITNTSNKYIRSKLIELETQLINNSGLDRSQIDSLLN